MSDVNVLHHILRNLLENGFKYAQEGTTITVAGTLDNGRVVISVEDEGPGIPVPLQEKIFERYFQVDESNRRRSGGVGLGLYISRQMAEMIGGRLWLERSDERGSVFCLSVPAVREEPSSGPNARVVVPAARG
jgi:signal transduction histidine kinase